MGPRRPREIGSQDCTTPIPDIIGRVSMNGPGKMRKESGDNTQWGDDEMTKWILSAAAGTYVLTAFGFAVSYTWQYAADWNLVSLIPTAVEHGYTWPVRLLG